MSKRMIELDFIKFNVIILSLTISTTKGITNYRRSLVYLASDSLILQLEATNEINIPAYVR